MNKRIANLWIEELESGYWEQNKYFLEHSQTYCVMGILANLAAMEGICSHSGFHIAKFDGEFLLLPQSILEWAELKTPTGELRKLKYSLAEMNDNGKTFKQLALIIRNSVNEL